MDEKLILYRKKTWYKYIKILFMTHVTLVT